MKSLIRILNQIIERHIKFNDAGFGKHEGC